MKNLLIILILITSNIGISYAQMTVGGVTMPKRVMIGKTTLTLNGAGVREKIWIDLYACGLYLKKKNTDANSIIDADEHMSIKIQIISSLITSDKMIEAVDEGFKKSIPKQDESLKEKIKSFKNVFAKEEIKQGDIYDIVYVPEKGTVIFKNGKIQPIIEGLDFKKALFSIWFGSNPADKGLKTELLGN
jgi:hypothetical protein